MISAMSTCAFPFGGNRNLFDFFTTTTLRTRLHVPSRLEGIETIRALRCVCGVLQCLHVPSRLEGMETESRYPCVGSNRSLHVPSRLEGMETFWLFKEDFRNGCGLHVPSRLEGIETLGIPQPFWGLGAQSTCAFPFGGNGNNFKSSAYGYVGIVYMCLPVWRESKRMFSERTKIFSFPSTCAFPFGGNRNTM